MSHPQVLPSVVAAVSILLVGSMSCPASARADSIGTSNDPQAIIGGGPSATCAWPSTVFLENCTGTLIHPEIVVYAAHCGADRERVWFGEDVSSGMVAPGEGFSVDTEYCKVNPDYATAEGIGEARAADYAFCKLAEPVLDVPIVPALMGCETTVLVPGAPVTLVGFGGTDQETFAVKFEVDTVLHYIDDFGVAVIGGGGLSPCAGDSGGPAFVQLPDGTWRAFGIVSGPNVGNCGDAMWFPTIHSAVPFIELHSGIDVSACHHSYGEWNPSPACGDVPLEPDEGEGMSWATGCAGGPLLETTTTCGPPFDASEDLLGPVTAITSPRDRARFDTEGGEALVAVDVTAEISDAVSGVASVQLVIGGTSVDGSLLLGPPWSWPVNLPPGVWTLQALATDWAGNEAYSAEVVVGVDQDPPPAPEPEPSTSSGAVDDSTSGEDATTSGDPPDLDGTGATEDGDGSSGASATPAGGDAGCGCRQSSGNGGNGPLALLGFVGLVAFARRRRRSGVLAATLVASCTSDGADAMGTDGTTEVTTSSPGTTGTSATNTSPMDPPDTSAGDGSSSASASTSTGPACEAGTLGCSCLEGFTCGEDLACMLDTCIECEAGTFTCPCRIDDAGTPTDCDDGLLCFGGLCAAPQACPLVDDGACDEPQGTGYCLPGTDASDCCPIREGVCEERSQGGACPDGSDPLDCVEATGSGGSSETGGSGDTGGSSSSGGD